MALKNIGILEYFRKSIILLKSKIREGKDS
jgi:hypothetical protein